MKQTHVYSLRLSSGMRKAMELAARRDRRSIASLTKKIIADYLAREGIDWERRIIQEDRRLYPRKDVSIPARLRIRKSPKGYYETEAQVENISMGGAYVTYTNGNAYLPAPSSKVNLVVRIAKPAAPLALDCRAVHVSRGEDKVGLGIQYEGIARKNLAAISRFLQ